MPAHSDVFPWPNSYGHFDFFERTMTSHRRITSVAKEVSGLYRLTRSNGETIRVFICECYSFGVAEYMETLEQLGDVNAIVINSAWCGYTYDAKLQCRREHVGLFMIGEFMGALNQRDFWRYLTDTQKEYFEKQGWL
jgi:hypothetical protein